MAAILRDSAVVIRMRPRAIPLTMITMRKSIHGFPFLSYMAMGLRLAALRAAGAPLSIRVDAINAIEILLLNYLFSSLTVRHET